MYSAISIGRIGYAWYDLFLGSTEPPQRATEERHSQEAISSRTGITGTNSEGTVRRTGSTMQAGTSTGQAGTAQRETAGSGDGGGSDNGSTFDAYREGLPR